MKDLEVIHLKTREMLEYTGQTKVHSDFISFSNKRTGVQERKKLRQRLAEEIKKHKDFKDHGNDYDWNNFLKA